jgi:hypothetical protein
MTKRIVWTTVVMVAAGVLLSVLPTGMLALDPVNDERVDLLDAMFGYDPATVTAVLSDLGAQGRAAYRLFHLCDMAFALSYCLWMMALLRPVTTRRWLWLGLPVVPAAADWVENVLLQVLSSRYPTVDTGLVGVASGFTVLKWSAVLAWALVTLVLWTRRWLRRPGGAVEPGRAPRAGVRSP